MLVLVTGATGKVGANVIRAPARRQPVLRSAASARSATTGSIEATDRIEVVQGSIADRGVAETAIAGVTHVVHLATCKETPDIVIDVTVKGLFWLLEAFRTSPAAKQFILIGGDAGIGHFFYAREAPVTETTPPTPPIRAATRSPRCWRRWWWSSSASSTASTGAACARRGSWRRTTSSIRSPSATTFSAGPTGRRWCRKPTLKRYAKDGTVPLLRDADGRPLRRNFVHVDDLVGAILAAIDNPRARAATLQRLHGPAGGLWRGRRLPEADARARLGGHSERVPLDLAG